MNRFSGRASLRASLGRAGRSIVIAIRWAGVGWTAFCLFTLACLLDTMGLSAAIVEVGLYWLVGMSAIVLAALIAPLVLWVGLVMSDGVRGEVASLIRSSNPARWLSMNYTVTETRLSGFLCPSSPPPTCTAIDFPTTATGNNYFASSGSSIEVTADMSASSPCYVAPWCSAVANPAPPNGMFYFIGYTGRPVTIAGIRDGLSNTVAFGEWKVGDGNKNQFTVPTDLVSVPAASNPFAALRFTPNINMPAGAAALTAYISLCASDQGVPADEIARYASLGESWALSLGQYTRGNLLVAPNPKTSNCNWSGGLASPGLWSLSSYHPGGANVLLADGSVRFLKDSTSQPTVWALGSIAQGEIISADSY